MGIHLSIIYKEALKSEIISQIPERIRNHPDGDPDDISGEVLRILNKKIQRDKLQNNNSE
jgi:hypothetical protein